MRSENIGPNHPKFNLSYPGWTQVLIMDDNDNIIGQFYGPLSKTNARNFINAASQNNKIPHLCKSCGVISNMTFYANSDVILCTCPICNVEWDIKEPDYLAR